MKKTSSGKQRQPVREPVLSPMEERVLGSIVKWAHDYAAAQAGGDRLAHLQTPTTEKCSKYFRYSHGEMLALLNRLESEGLIVKRRRQSAGLDGNGFDGALYSEVIPTDWGREVLSRTL